MHRTTTSVGTSGRFPATPVTPPDLDPAWRPWVRLLDVALGAAEAPGWVAAPAVPDPDRPFGAPLLHGATLRLEPRRARSLVRELLRTADRSLAERGDTRRDEAPPDVPSRARGRRSLDALGVIEAAIGQDTGAIERLATSAAVDADLLAAIAQLAAMPVLAACAVSHRDRIPKSWMHGYCPVCGAWPGIAETRGLERSRRLRCGRCSSDWPIPVLRCPYCDELDHAKLHALVPDGNEQTQRVDVCDTCKGYLKTYSTLQPMSLRSLAMMDLATVELDIAARDRGYARPERPGFALSVTVRRSPAVRADVST